MPMNIDLMPAAPEIVLLGLLCAVLVADLFVPADKKTVTFWMAIVSLAVTAWALVATVPEATVYTFSGAYVADGLSLVLKAFSLLLVGVSFLYARDILAQYYIGSEIEQKW